MLSARGLHLVGAVAAVVLLGVALATAVSTGEAGPGLWWTTAVLMVVVLTMWHRTRDTRSFAALLAGPLMMMGFLLAYGWLAPVASTYTLSLWPAVFTFVGVTLSARTGLWLLPVAAIGIWSAMDLPVGVAVPRWLVVMGLVLVVTQVPSRLLASLREQQSELAREHRDVVDAQAALAITKERFEQAFAGSPVGMSLADEDGLFVEVNPALCRIVGRPAEDLLGHTSAHVTHPEDRHLSPEAMAALRTAGGGPVVVEKRYVRPDGQVRRSEVTMVTVRGPGEHPWTLAHVTDITDRWAAEQTAARAERVSRVLADVTRSVVQRRDDVRTAVVQGAQQLTGASGVALVESFDEHGLVVTAATDPDQVGVRVDLAQLTMTGSVWHRGVAVDVEDVAAEATVNPAMARVHSMVSGYWQPVLGPDGEVLAVLTAAWFEARSAASAEVRQAMEVLAAEAGAALHEDLTRRRLEASVTLDPLTGLANRRGWDEGLAELVARTVDDDGVVAVAMIDLDHFKQYNDAHGHAAGDALLVGFAETLRHSVRAPDLVSRWGGDEFAVAMSVPSAQHARTVVDRIVGAVPAGQTCSIGLALHGAHDDVAATLARADRALYAVKDAGRDGVVVASS
ncbi:diguanylate cyclase domain-containing protein [Solicola sp. PLA-1-18]|uniref:sensor domain-containing diguanylate cyclase n=1 Tax=Solicola sp. PLA-1-18 TaxID=3380532 RepID=UPI003B7648C2